jgi:hypothetical protein
MGVVEPKMKKPRQMPRLMSIRKQKAHLGDGLCTRKNRKVT